MITKEELIQKINELIKPNNSEMLGKIDIILNSNCIDLDDYDNNYLLPKIIFTALLIDASEKYEPFGKEAKKEVRNILKFL